MGVLNQDNSAALTTQIILGRSATTIPEGLVDSWFLLPTPACFLKSDVTESVGQNEIHGEHNQRQCEERTRAGDRRTLSKCIAVRERSCSRRVREAHRIPQETCRTASELRAPTVPATCHSSQRICDEAVKQALVAVWETADRICGKRLKMAMPECAESLERHGHLNLDDELRRKLLTVSTTTIDRILSAMSLRPRERAKPKGKRKKRLKSQIPIRTFGDWHESTPVPLESDSVAHNVRSSRVRAHIPLPTRGSCIACAGRSSLRRVRVIPTRNAPASRTVSCRRALHRSSRMRTSAYRGRRGHSPECSDAISSRYTTPRTPTRRSGRTVPDRRFRPTRNATASAPWSAAPSRADR